MLTKGTFLIKKRDLQELLQQAKFLAISQSNTYLNKITFC